MPPHPRRRARALPPDLSGRAGGSCDSEGVHRTAPSIAQGLSQRRPPPQHDGPRRCWFCLATPFPPEGWRRSSKNQSLQRFRWADGVAAALPVTGWFINAHSTFGATARAGRSGGGGRTSAVKSHLSCIGADVVGAERASVTHLRARSGGAAIGSGGCIAAMPGSAATPGNAITLGVDATPGGGGGNGVKARRGETFWRGDMHRRIQRRGRMSHGARCGGSADLARRIVLVEQDRDGRWQENTLSVPCQAEAEAC